MMLRGKTNASAKKDGFISPDLAKPGSNLRNLRIFPTPRPRSSRSTFYLFLHLRLSASICGLSGSAAFARFLVPR